jgi:DNA adenine methylase
VRFHKEALIGELRGYINARANFLDLLRNPGFTDLQRAARWYLLKVCSFGSQGQTWGRDRRDFHGWDADRLVPLIDQLAVRLERVTIECGDWEKVVEFYDAPDAFFFFDPPYVNCGDTAYAAFTAADMARVRRRLDKLKGQWLLTCDDSPECRKVFSGLPAQPMSIRYSLAKNGSAKDSGELLVFHPALAPSDLATLKFPQKGRRAVA